MPEGAVQALERRALRASIGVSLAFTVVAVVWGLLVGSQAILLDAIFTPLSLIMTWGSLMVSRLVARGPSDRFPFGRDALIPLFVIAQAVTLVGALAYAVVDAVRVVLAGGADVAGGALLGYGLFSVMVCLGTWWWLNRMANGQTLVEAEAAGWLAAAGSSVVLVAGGIAVLVMQGTGSADAARYADSILVMISSLALLAIPLRLVRSAIRELQNPVPGPATQQQVRELVAAVRLAEGLPEPILRLGRIGSTLTLELGFVLEPGEGDIACEDRVRRALRDGLSDIPYEPWVVVEFSYDAALLE